MLLKPVQFLFTMCCLLWLLNCTPEANRPAPTAVVLPEIVLPERPNILWLVAEDLGPYIPSFGDSTISTPNLSRLAAEGVCFDQFFSPSPVCSPSRAAIATGMYPTRIGANHMRTGPWYSNQVTEEQLQKYSKDALPDGIHAYEAQPEAGVKMFSEFLRAAGYYCTNNAKQDYQFRQVATAWDESGREAHWKNRKPGQPFFAVFNFEVTHESRIWRKAQDSLWVDPNLEVPVPPYLPGTDVGLKDIRRMYSNIKEMDYRVGLMLNELEESGLLDSTIIFWYTDHGGPLPRMKRLLYDSGIHVPMIIRYPNQQRSGTRDDRLLSFIDLGPTVLSLTKLKPADYFDGRAFAGPYSSTENRDYIFGAADRFDGQYDRNRSVRTKQFKYIQYLMPEKPMLLPVKYREQMPIMQELLRLHEIDSLNEIQALWFRSTKPNEELFDVTNDPHEIRNLANDPTYQETLAQLRQACQNWYQSFFDTGLIPEPELLEKLWPNGQQPIVQPVQVTVQDNHIVLSCETPGASIGYQLVTSANPGKPSWQVYQHPIPLKKGMQLSAIADRIGYQASEIIKKEF